MNTLYDYGDNLDVLRRHAKDESVDLVYLAPAAAAIKLRHDQSAAGMAD